MWPFLTLAITLSSPLSLFRRARNATKPEWHPEAREWTKRTMERAPRPLLRGELDTDWWEHRREELGQDVWQSAREELDRFIQVTPFKRDIHRREFLLKYFDGRQSLDYEEGDPRRKTHPRYAARHGMSSFRESVPDNHSLAP